MNILIMGGPGAGKGSMSARLVETFKIVHISTGDIFRSEIRNTTKLGILAKSYIDQGLLVPDDVVNDMVESYLKQQDLAKGYLLDGYPRTLQQAKAFNAISENTPYAIDLVIVLDIAVEALAKRITGRRICQDCGSIYHLDSHPSKVDGICDDCGGKLYQREDDTVESLKTRIIGYEQQTLAVLGYYANKGIVTHIDASQKIDDVWRDVAALVK